MTLRARGIKIRNQILKDVGRHPTDIAQHICKTFLISRQASNVHLKKLLAEDWLESTGSTRKKVYKLGTHREEFQVLPIVENFREDIIYDDYFSWVFEGLRKNIKDIIFYGFTEIVNNAFDHSQGKKCTIRVKRNKEQVLIFIVDDGEGIFKRITRLKQLTDERQAIFELYKGKLTTDPENHSGQGIFFTSKMFDRFTITSHELTFNHVDNLDFDFLEDNASIIEDLNTIVFMKIAVNSTRTMEEIFDKFSGGEDEDFAFNKTIIPVNMARFNQENLVSRSQAKRLLVRIESFKYVIFDFKNVESIGQAFADEIFRVYRRRHSLVLIGYSNANEAVERMIKRAEAT